MNETITMIAFSIVLGSLLPAMYMWRRSGEEPAFGEKLSNGDASATRIWDHVLDQYGIPFGQFCIATIYTMFMKLTLINALVFTLKYVPTGIYMYRFIKDIYVTSRKRLKKKEMELEDIQLQIKIMNTKLCVREAECTELAATTRREAARLREARARVREAVAADDALGPAFERWLGAPDRRVGADEPDLADLLKELKYDVVERQNNELESGERAHFDSPKNSVYSSPSDIETNADCRIKIVKVTKVYKVAYLKHYIKQKRLRRASKQAFLKKKMESIKKVLEDWQKSLSLVMNSNLPMLEARAYDTSEEAMGDHSKPRDPDSDPDLRADNCYDEYTPAWLQLNRNYYEEPEGPRELFESHEYGDQFAQCERAGHKGAHALFLLPRLPEETCSQLAVDDIKDDVEDFDHEDSFVTV